MAMAVTTAGVEFQMGAARADGAKTAPAGKRGATADNAVMFRIFSSTTSRVP